MRRALGSTLLVLAIVLHVDMGLNKVTALEALVEVTLIVLGLLLLVTPDAALTES